LRHAIQYALHAKAVSNTLQKPQRIKKVGFPTGIRPHQQIEMPELEIDALQAFEVADL
jgi:hypothetical protein